MLDEFCAKLSDKAQLKIALRLAKIALPIWDDYFFQHPEGLKELNDLVGETNRVKGGNPQINVKFLERALKKIEDSYFKAEEEALNPIPIMKKDLLLSPVMATCIQPLTNNKWDTILSNSVRLVYTSVWNILTWLLMKRKNEEGETHIYIAINQAADALLSEKILTAEDINAILLEYEKETRKEGEDTEWENSIKEKEGSYDSNDIYLKIAGTKKVKDAPAATQTGEILRQMKEEGKSFWDKWEEYYSGTSNTYSFDKEKKCYTHVEIDVIVASFCNEYIMTEAQMEEFVSGLSLHDLRESGFEI
jgi:hypothetical protein